MATLVVAVLSTHQNALPPHPSTHRYRIECKRWIHVNATPDAQGMGRCVQYQEEMEAADRLYEERHSLDRKKEQVGVGEG
jgi:hypothetical protein